MASRTFIESREEMEEILREEEVGYLGVSVDGTPYVVPLNYSYEDGRILFHCALTGKKLDGIRAHPEVCFTVGRQTGEVRRHAESDVCHVDSDSVICCGTARVVDDVEERKEILNAFNRRYRSDAGEISLKQAQNCGAVEIRISEMTGRRERGQKRTYWRYVFEG